LITIKIPLTRFNNIIATLGIDAHQFHDNFNPVKTRTPYPIIYGGEEDVRRRIIVEPNAFASAKTSSAYKIFEKYAARILIPDRLWWDTAHVVALYCKEPVLSNIFYVIKLKVEESIREYVEKALVLWLNTTWGMLTVLFDRQETRGRWTRLKMSQWRLLQVLDVTSLEISTLKQLANIFDKYANKSPRRIPEQFNPSNPDPIRLGIDKEFLIVINPSINEARIEDTLKNLYRHIDLAFKMWIGE